jgi:hypothetical protein
VVRGARRREDSGVSAQLDATHPEQGLATAGKMAGSKKGKSCLLSNA